MEEKEQEMEKLRHELKDKEVENKIAGKKGDQLVRTSLFVQFLSLFQWFNFSTVLESWTQRDDPWWQTTISVKAEKKAWWGFDWIRTHAFQLQVGLYCQLRYEATTHWERGTC